MFGTPTNSILNVNRQDSLGLEYHTDVLGMEYHIDVLGMEYHTDVTYW